MKKTRRRTQELYQQTRGFDFVRLWENRVWSVHDLHSTAYKNLLTERTLKNKKDKPNATATRMEDNLRRYKGETYTVATDTACLACHASVRRPIHARRRGQVGHEVVHDRGRGRVRDVPRARVEVPDKHQESQEIDEANAPEGASRVVDWREWPPAEKKKWGLVDLRNPVEATAQCASCHVGNTRDGRFVTHEMFAAGHPPLPPLDLIAYTREQPRHWGLPSEMPYLTGLVKKDAKKAEAVFHVRERRVARRPAVRRIDRRHAPGVGRTRRATRRDRAGEGGRARLRRVRLLVVPPQPEVPQRPPGPRVPRQARAPALPPGHLRAHQARHRARRRNGGRRRLEEVAQADSLAAEKKLADAFTDKSLGDPAKVIAATADIVKWSDDALKKLAAVRYTPKATQELLAKLTDAEAAEKPVADPEVAQLYTWAYETLVLDLDPGTKDAETGKGDPAGGGRRDLRDKLEGSWSSRGCARTRCSTTRSRAACPARTVQPVDERIGARMKLFNSFQDAPSSARRSSRSRSRSRDG